MIYININDFVYAIILVIVILGVLKIGVNKLYE